MAARFQFVKGYPAAQKLARAAVIGLLVLAAQAVFAQSAPEIVGRIEGDDLAVKGQVSLQREAERNTAELVSGAKVTVRSGLARITLADGGEMDICGPAHFTVLKSGGSITVALNLGRVHVRVGSTPKISIYTALLVAEPLSAGGAPRDAVIGVEPDGSIGVNAAHGAVRLEQQLTGQSLIVPQSGEVLLAGGQLDALRDARGACRCEPVFARAEPKPKPPQIGGVALSSESAAKPPESKKEQPKPAKEEPTWTVVMPPLTFDANQPPPALEPRAETILLVRELRVQPAVVFTGRVEKPPKVKAAKKQTGEIAAAAPPARESNSVSAVAVAGTPEGNKSSIGFGAKLRNFFRRLFGGKPKS